MNQQIKTLVPLAVAGLASGCGGTTPPADTVSADTANEPSGDKDGCKGEPGEKHSCGADMKDETPKGEAGASAVGPAPAASDDTMPK